MAFQLARLSSGAPRKGGGASGPVLEGSSEPPECGCPAVSEDWKNRAFQLARQSSGARQKTQSWRSTMPDAGFGEKNVVFGGMRVPASATARISVTVAGRRRIAAS